MLNLLDINGAIITLDAMGTQRDIAAQIVDQGGDYILALKGNQGTLHQRVKAFFKAAEQTQWVGIEVCFSITSLAAEATLLAQAIRSDLDQSALIPSPHHFPG